MELTGLQTQPQTTTLQGTAGADVASQASSSGASASVPVLGGENVRFSSTTDFEKLLAEMQADRDKTLQQSFKSQFSAALTTLTGRYENLNAEQQKALDGVASATDALSQATANAELAQETYEASAVLLAVETAKLEAMVEASVTTPEDRAEELERESREQEIRYTEEEIQTQREVVAAQQQVVNANRQALNEANDAKVAAEESLKTAVNALDSLCQGVFVEACVISSRLLSVAAAERGDSSNEHVSGIIEAIGDYADKLQEMQDKELEEAVAKIVPDLVYLVSANYTIVPGDLPQYERRV